MIKNSSHPEQAGALDISSCDSAIVCCIETGRIFFLNRSGVDFLKQLHQSVAESCLNNPSRKPLLNLLEQSGALIKEDGRVQLKPNTVRIYPYDEKARYLQQPISIMLEVTPACDLQCVYCCVAENNAPQGKILSRAEMREVVNALVNSGVSAVTITGGEPFMRQRSHGDLFEIIHTLGSHHIHVNLFTNGTMLYQYAHELCRSAIKNITVSLDASTPQLFEHIAGRPYFHHVIEGMNAISGQGKFVRIAMVLTTHNYQDWRNMVDLARTTGANALFLLRAYPLGRACKNPAYIIQEEEWQTLRKEIYAYSKAQGIHIGGGRGGESEVPYPFGNCKAGTTFCVINYDGTISPCAGFKSTIIGDLRAQPFQELWISQRWDAFRDCQYVCPIPDRDVFMMYLKGKE